MTASRFPVLYSRRLAANATTTDLARSGFTSDDVLSQIDDASAQAATRSASVIVIMIGANDLAAVFTTGGDTTAYQQAAATLRANVTEILRRLQAVRRPAVPILVLGYWNILEDGEAAHKDYTADDSAQASILTAYTNDALRSAAIAEADTYVPTTAAFKGNSGTDDPTRLLSDDGDHPNARGHAAIAAALYAAQPAVAP